MENDVARLIQIAKDHWNTDLSVEEAEKLLLEEPKIIISYSLQDKLWFENRKKLHENN